MWSERGQATIEWIGATLLLALALGALGRVAARVDAAPVATALLGASTCAARGDCGERGAVQATPRAQTVPRAPRPAVTVPPLVPHAPRERIGRAPSDPLRRAPSERLGRPPALARRSVGALWRRAWLLCFGYERARFGLLRPETGPRQTVPLSGVLQMVNDCVSPFDFARDWEHLRPR